MLFGLWLHTTEKTNSTYSTHIAWIICNTKIKRMLTLTIKYVEHVKVNWISV